MSKKQYVFRGKKYYIDDKEADRIIDDFLYCESIQDWKTIDNRIKNGLKWGWMTEVT